MSAYVILYRTEYGYFRYLENPKTDTFTDHVDKAKKFRTRENAEQHRLLANESVVTLAEAHRIIQTNGTVQS